MSSPPAAALLDNLLAFGQALRAAGLDVHVGRVLDAIDALQHVDIAARDDVYHTLRSLLIHRHADFAVFDRVFGEFWLGRARSGDAAGGDARPDTAIEVVTGTIVIKTWSDADVLAEKDFAALTPGELAQARAVIETLAWTPLRRTRRWIGGPGPRIDLRRALSRSLRTGGEIVALPRRRRKIKPRPIVLLCDVSGSMERYSRTVLHFAHTLSKKARRVEAFVFATRLTRITMDLRTSRADAAIAAAARSVQDWSGGTRIGAALRAFHQRWARRSLSSAAVVLLISDGWDRGDPAVLRDQIARLQRGCHRLIWLNPLIGTIDYAPLTQGLQAALPFVDDFLPVRTLRDVRDLASHLKGLRA
jgi:uncharacterized protein with von Willebrand factor type A (vWA) domain